MLSKVEPEEGSAWALNDVLEHLYQSWNFQTSC